MSLADIKKRGVSQETTNNFIVDAGAVYVFPDIESLTGTTSKGLPIDATDWDDHLLGATRDGNTFTVTQELREMEIDGAKGRVKGARRVINVVPNLVANMLELNSEIFHYAFPGTDIEDWPDEADLETGDMVTHDLLQRTRNIQLADYIDLVALVGTISKVSEDGQPGEPVVMYIENGLSDQEISLDTADDDEAVMELQFTGHFDPANLDTEPWGVIYPKDEPTEVS